MIPSYDDLVKIAKGLAFKAACTLDCNKCDWQKRKEDCRELAKKEIENGRR
jgi:hypothetical protein